jgi:hypothetical protein
MLQYGIIRTGLLHEPETSRVSYSQASSIYVLPSLRRIKYHTNINHTELNFVHFNF